MRTFRTGGIHPDDHKITSHSMPQRVEFPAEMRIMLSQNIGAPSKPAVKAADHVEAGQLLAQAGGFVGADIHAPCSGTVKKLDLTRNPQGMWQECIILEPDPEQKPQETHPRSAEEIAALTPAEITGIVADAGIVGLGGATFPTRVKLSVPEGKKADYLIINGAECEPWLTCDDILMQTEAEAIVKGSLLIARAAGCGSVMIGIEENKPEAIVAMRKAAMPHSNISVEVLKKKYPQGSEKQLIYAATGRQVPPGRLPIDCGCIVDNVATAFAVYDAVAFRRPLTERIVTVTGPSLSNPGNFIASIGTPMSLLIEAAGGLPEDTGKVIAGGPMMGRACSTIDAPMTKGLSGIVVVPASEADRNRPSNCMRCAKCVSVCPMGLEPYLLAQFGRARRWGDAASHGALNCLECGCCNYICPSARPILDFVRLAKSEIRKMPKKD